MSYLSLFEHQSRGVHSFLTSSSIEKLVDEGRLFGVSPILTVTPTTNQLVTLTTGAGVATHIYISFTATASFQVNIYTGSTITTPGTIVPNGRFNLSNVSTTSGLVVRTGAVASALGTKISDFLIPGGRGNNAIGGAVSQGSKIILPPSAVYTFEVDNLSTGNNDENFELVTTFYEVPL